MEFATNGSLEDADLPTSWTETLDTLLAILDALAHAHARGVVHRDLKPANVLRCGPSDLRPGLKLADFGLAFESGSKVHMTGAGTPAYMAPEQVLRRWWDLGPWTDLYALGGMAWEMITGERPYPGDNPAAVGRAQVEAELPEFVPRFSIPRDTEAWLRELLEKHPSARPQSAAACARDLLSLGGVDDSSQVGASRQRSTRTLLTLIPPAAPDTGAETTVVASTTELALPLRSASERTHRMVPVPGEWRASLPIRPPQLDSAGLGLFGLRVPPFTARNAVREQLWNALRQVVGTGVPQAVLVQGEAGLGKTRLVRWLGTRASELGCAKTVGARFDVATGVSQGLSDLVESAHRVRRVKPGIAIERLALHGADAGPLVSLGSGEPVDSAVGLVATMMLRLSGRQPLVVWLDDAHLDDAALILLETLLREARMARAPILVLATIETGALRLHPNAARRVDVLGAQEGVSAISMGPFAEKEMAMLVERLLPLGQGLRATVVEASAGNPMVTTELLRSWALAEQLVATPEGLELVHGVPQAAPEGLTEVWRQRLLPIQRAWTEDERQSVRLAACLGKRVAVEEWEAACRRLLLSTSPRPVEDLAREGLVHEERGGFRFTHGLVRGALLHDAELAGVLGEYHSVCADALDPGQAERVGRHLQAAGRDDEAVAFLVQGAMARAEWSDDYRHALWLLDQARALLERLDASDTDPRWEDLYACWLRCLSNLREQDQILDAAPELLARSRRNGWTQLEHRSLFAMAHTFVMWGALDRGEAMYQQLLGSDIPKWRVVGLRGLGNVAQARRDWDPAQAHYRRCHELALEVGDPFQIARSANDLGVVAERTGRLEEAAKYFRFGLEICEANGFRDAHIGRLNLASCKLRAGRVQEAHALYKACLAAAEADFMGVAITASQVFLLRTSAELADWDTWQQAASQVRSLLERVGLVDMSLAESLSRAGEFAHAAGFGERAQMAWELAKEQYEAVQRQEDAARMAAQIDALD